MTARHPGAGGRVPGLRPSDVAPRRPDRPEMVFDKMGSAHQRAKLGAVRQCAPEEYLRLGLLAADYATDEHPAGSEEADALGAELLAMLGLTDKRRLYALRRLRRAAGEEAAA